jgi:hypothetical protein
MKNIFISITAIFCAKQNRITIDNLANLIDGAIPYYLKWLEAHAITVPRDEFKEEVSLFLIGQAAYISSLNARLTFLSSEDKQKALMFLNEIDYICESAEKNSTNIDSIRLTLQ